MWHDDILHYHNFFKVSLLFCTANVCKMNVPYVTSPLGTLLLLTILI